MTNRLQIHDESIVDKVVKTARAEQRSLSQMGGILIERGLKTDEAAAALLAVADELGRAEAIEVLDRALSRKKASAKKAA